jgi:glucuronosyltransferase
VERSYDHGNEFLDHLSNCQFFGTRLKHLEESICHKFSLESLVFYFVCFLSEGDGRNIYNLERHNVVELGIQSWLLSGDMCSEILSDKSVQELIHSRDIHFDLIILEAFFSECFLPFGYKFKAPIIKFCTFGGTYWMGDWVGNPSPYSYVPNGLLDFSDRMNLWERVLNSLSNIFFRLGRQFYYLPRQDKIVRPFFKDADSLPHLSELDATSTALVLLNSHFSISYAKPLMPNLVQVGGLHIKAPKKLPDVSVHETNMNSAFELLSLV